MKTNGLIFVLVLGFVSPMLANWLGLHFLWSLVVLLAILIGRWIIRKLDIQ